MIKINEDEFRKICNESQSMAQAAVKLGIHFNTFKRYAVKFGCYFPNMSGKGMSKKSNPKIILSEIIDGQHPHFQTFKLKKRLIKENLLENKCSECGLTEWNGKSLNMELDHIDGNRTNHLITNLRMLCPNCHSQTDTYRAKNIK